MLSLCSVTVSFIFLAVTCSDWSQAVVVDESRMLAAVQRLSQKFSNLKTYGLAVDSLQVCTCVDDEIIFIIMVCSLQTEYSNADISYSILSNVTDLVRYEHE